MAKYKLLLDESGTFANNGEKYIIIGGVLFNVDDQDYLEKVFFPLHKHLCNVYEKVELHASDNKKDYYSTIAPLIGSMDEVKPVIFVIDKENSYIFDQYDDNSFKYNKAIEHLIKKMISDGVIKEDDELFIRIDNINLSKKGKLNLSKYLPDNLNVVKEVKEGDSKNYISLQLADIIVNHFSKKRKSCVKSDKSFKLLNPALYFFLDDYKDEYIK